MELTQHDIYVILCITNMSSQDNGRAIQRREVGVLMDPVRLRRGIRERVWTTGDAAAVAGVPLRTVQRALSGQRIMPKSATRILQAFIVMKPVPGALELLTEVSEEYRDAATES
jgi:hypothetical protein